MDYKTRPRLGPLGTFMQIPSPSARDGVEMQEAMIGGSQQSMYGRTTTDVFDHKDSWTFRWPYATHAQYVRLRMLWLNPPPVELRFWDPFVKNLLDRKQAMTNGLGDSVHVREGNGSAATLRRRWTDDTPLGRTSGEDYWVCTGGGTFSFVTGLDVPLLGVGLPLTLSALVRGVGSVSMAYRVRDASDALGAPQYGAAVTLGATAVPVSLTIPAAAAGVGVRPFLSTGGNAQVYVRGQQAELGPTRTDWEPGNGCPEVFISDFSYKRLPLGRYDISFSLQEV